MGSPIFISRENLDRLGLDPTQTTLALTTAGTEYSFTVPDNTKRLIIGLRSGAYNFTYGWVTTTRNFTVPAGVYRDISDVYLVGKTLFVSCADASAQTLEIEYFL